jgi:hypothetical protein
VASVTEIPGIGKTFAKDFARIGLHSVEDFKGETPEDIFIRLSAANATEDHNTSKNYLYVLRMVIYYANGGRDPNKLKWAAWKG